MSAGVLGVFAFSLNGFFFTFSFSYQLCLGAPTVCKGRSHGSRVVVYVCAPHSLTHPPPHPTPRSESTACPPRVKFPWRGRDAEPTARVSDFASSYLGLERLTKANSSGLMIREELGTCAAACIKHTERKPSRRSSSSSQEQLFTSQVICL